MWIVQERPAGVEPTMRRDELFPRISVRSRATRPVPSSVLHGFEISSDVQNDTAGPIGLQAAELGMHKPSGKDPCNRSGGGRRMSEEERGQATEELTSQQKRANVIRLAFAGSEERFNEFVDVVRQAIPPRTGVVLRGSAVTGER